MKLIHFAMHSRGKDKVHENKLGRDYGRFWLAQTTSFLGSGVSTFALPLIAALTLSASPLQMGLLVTGQNLPNLLIGPLMGPLVDRVKLRTLLVNLDLLRAVLIAAIPVAYLLGTLNIFLVTFVAFFLGFANVIFDVGYVAFVQRLVPESRLLAANARLEGSYSVAQVTGPGIGGILVAIAGAPVTLVIDVISFLFSAITIKSITEDGTPGPHPITGSLRPYLAEAWSGTALIFRTPSLRLLGVGSSVFNLFAGATASCAALFALRNLHISESWYGSALAIGAIGGVIGAASVEKLGKKLGTSSTFAAGLVLAGIGQLLIITAQPSRPFFSTILVAASQFLAIFGTTIYIVASLTVRQQLVPKAQFGTVYASMRMLSRGTVSIGALLGGYVAATHNLRWVLLIAAIGQIITALVFTRYRHQMDLIKPSV